jgi:hypothetical protein
MANFAGLTQGNNGDLQSNVILQEALDTFNKDLGFLGSIHRDFGGQAMRFNQELVTRIWDKRAASDVKTFAQATGYATADEDSDADPVAIKLDQHPFIKFHLTDTEREQSQVDLITEPARQAAHALAKSVADALCSEAITNADTITTVAESAWGMDDIFKLAKAMDDEDMPSNGRWLLMSTQAYYATLNALQGYTNATYNVGPGISEAALDQRLAGFQVYTYTGLQSVDTAGVDVLAGYGNSLAMVNRLPEFADASMQVGDIANATEPSSGLSLQLRRKYDVMVAKEEYALTLLYGLKAPNDGTNNRILKQIIT